MPATRSDHNRARHLSLTTDKVRETADLTLRLLEYLATQPGAMGVTELAQQFETSKATIHRHLRTLLHRQFVSQDPLTSRYESGIKLFELGEASRNRLSIYRAGRDAMVQLRDVTGQAVTLSTLSEGRVMVLDLVQGHTVVEFGIRPGTQMGLHNSAHGKVALAFGPPALLAACLQNPLSASSKDTITSPQQLEKHLRVVRKQGWATAANEVVFGVNALAAPIYDYRRAFIGALAIVGSTQFIKSKPAPEQLAQVLGAAALISQRLGWSPA